MRASEWIDKTVWFRSLWNNSTTIFHARVVSISTITPDAHRIYAFVQEFGWRQPRPVSLSRLHLTRREQSPGQ